MYIPRPYFTNVPNLGNLELDYIFMEDGYPLLFTCKSKDKLYICVCRTLSPKQKWVISETNVEILEKMVRKIIPIRSAFKLLNAHSWIITWSKETDHEYSDFPTSELNDQELPSYNVFLSDDDADDAIDYISNLKSQPSIIQTQYIQPVSLCELHPEYLPFETNITINAIRSTKVDDHCFDIYYVAFDEEKKIFPFVDDHPEFSVEKKFQFAKTVGNRFFEIINGAQRNSQSFHELCAGILHLR